MQMNRQEKQFIHQRKIFAENNSAAEAILYY